jgi:hypothetical protein
MSLTLKLNRALEAVAPSFHKDLQLLQWRMQCARRVLAGCRESRRLDALATGLLTELREQGIVLTEASTLFSHDPSRYTAALNWATQAWVNAQAMVREGGPAALERLSGRRYGKEFKLALLPPDVPFDHPFVRLALDQRLLSIANCYMGMRTYLRSINLWWDLPTEGPPKASQLWHRDMDDKLNVKVFFYFSDVDRTNGPFCFIPQSHPLGRRRLLKPEGDTDWRTTDEQMARVVPVDAWRMCTAPKGTVIFCDTCGYHKGLKPERGDRLLLQFQYTSTHVRPPATGRLRLLGDPGWTLSSLQRWAVSFEPWKQEGGAPGATVPDAAESQSPEEEPVASR